MKEPFPLPDHCAVTGKHHVRDPIVIESNAWERRTRCAHSRADGFADTGGTVKVPGDLFGPVIPGLSLIEEIFDTAAQAELIGRIEAAPLSAFRFQQWIGARETASYGLHYDFTGSGLTEAEPFPVWLAQLSYQIEQTFDLCGGAIVHALLTRYRPGASIGWHRDRPIFGEVFGVSLGAAARLRFRKKEGSRFARYALNLPPGSIYRMRGDARQVWEHSIAGLPAWRWSITLRTLATEPST